MQSRSAEAVICRRHGGYYHVLTQTHEEVPCRVKGILKKQGTRNLAVVGDRVRVDIPAEGDALIAHIYPRQSSLIRAKGFADKGSGRSRREGQILISNLDQVFVLLPCKEPDFHPMLLDRFLVLVESMDLQPILLLNKIDLLESPACMQPWIQLYREIGYPVLPVSVSTGEGLEAVRQKARDRTSFLMGPSGAGKSSLMNHLQPKLELATGTWSERCKTGPQTTTHTCLYPLDFNTFIADTAGFSQIFLFHLPRWELRWYMPDITRATQCRYHDCLHREGEEECSLPQAVQSGKLDANRLKRYRKLLEECNSKRLLDE